MKQPKLECVKPDVVFQNDRNRKYYTVPSTHTSGRPFSVSLTPSSAAVSAVVASTAVVTSPVG